ncbi:MAG TPA: hypothetical protein PLQ19_03090 [Aeromicrobium sp.]|nr:hypothetical protein [Aeromicrobium sp.]
MAIVAHGHEIRLVTGFRVQVLAKAAVFALAAALTWLLPVNNPLMESSLGEGAGSTLVDLRLPFVLIILIGLGVIAFSWQRIHGADMGALAWVVAAGLMVLASIVLVLLQVSSVGVVYGWLALGVSLTSTFLAVLATLIGHGFAVALSRRS